jgi:hypothetical protein
VRRAQVGERGEQVVVGPHVVSCYLPIRENRKKDIHDVVGECPAIDRVMRDEITPE